MSALMRDENPPLHIVLNISQAAADLLHLGCLFDMWTSACVSGKDLDVRDRAELSALGNKVYDQLSIVERHADKMHQFFNTYAEWVNEQLRSDLGGEHFTDPEKAKILTVLAVEDNNFAKRGVAISEYLRKEMPIQRVDLRKTLMVLDGDNSVVPDLDVTFASRGIECPVLAASTMLGLLSCPKIPVGCVVAFAGGAALIHFCS